MFSDELLIEWFIYFCFSFTILWMRSVVLYSLSLGVLTRIKFFSIIVILNYQHSSKNRFFFSNSLKATSITPGLQTTTPYSSQYSIWLISCSTLNLTDFSLYLLSSSNILLIRAMHLVYSPIMTLCSGTNVICESSLRINLESENRRQSLKP